MRTSYLLKYAQLDLDQRATGRVLGDFELDAPTWLDVEFEIKGAKRPVTGRAPENCDTGEQPQAVIKHALVCKSPMKLVAADELMLILPTGFDVTEYLSKSTIEMMEEALMSELEAA
jgi:hypothetical protein